MNREEKYELLLNLTWRSYLNNLRHTPMKPGELRGLFWQELAFDEDDLIAYVKENGLPKTKKTENLRLGIGLDYYFESGEWIIDFYERGGPIGSTSTKDPIEVVKLLISDEFPGRE